MTDISKCEGFLDTDDDKLSCPWKETCYRYYASENPYWQSWMGFPGDFEFDGNFVCNEYWKR